MEFNKDFRKKADVMIYTVRTVRQAEPKLSENVQSKTGYRMTRWIFHAGHSVKLIVVRMHL